MQKEENSGIMEVLDIVQKSASIVASTSILVALLSYFYRKGQDKVSAVADQIAFFREKILVKDLEIYTYISANIKNDYIFKQIRLDNPSRDFVMKNFREELKEQLKLIQDKKVYFLQTEILNMMEEFATRVMYYGTQDHGGLNSLRYAFVSMVEVNATTLLFYKEIGLGESAFPGIFQLYNLWKERIDRTLPKERLDKFLSEVKSL